jgi:hypothetical protein
VTDRSPLTRALRALFAGLVMLGAGAMETSAQLVIRDLVVSGGASAEGYQGNLPSIGVPVRDSTNFASAAIGEVSVSADLAYPLGVGGSLDLTFDGGFRQFAAQGFTLKDYAPRELVGTLDVQYSRTFGSRIGASARARLEGRQVDDRPPMPLFLQPGFRAGEMALAASVRGPREVVYDVQISGSRSDFLAPEFAPQIRLLNRESYRGEVGATLASGGGSLRVFGGGEGSRFPKQNTFDSTDPVRRDVTFHGGASWTYQADYLVQMVLEGRANRSNSLRPEYDALTLRGLFTASVAEGVVVSVYGALTAKQYLHESRFARLLPGEEANSASLAYVSVTRSLARNLDGTLRMGWTRAETEIGGAYFQRFGGSFILNYRPVL